MNDTDIITGDEVRFHDDPAIVLPKAMTYEKAYKVLRRLQEDAETVVELNRVFRYRPNDGAVATATVMKATFGVTFGAGMASFFGSTPPATKSVQISHNETIDVPWGRVIVPSIERLELYLMTADDPEYGAVFHLNAEVRKRDQHIVKKLFDDVEKELQANSIYRGKAVVGTGEPEFLDLGSVRPNEIVFSDQVITTLEGTLWSVLRHREVLKAEGVKIKRAILLEGAYGTGKTSAGQLTALEAVANGWTFIAARPGRDNVTEVLRTARLYQPAVVFVEDIDNQASGGEADQVSQLLETFDGITSKGSELCLLMTTNHFDRIHKGMLRPGRIDAVIEVGELDRQGVERLIRAIVPADKLDPTTDFDAVYSAMSGFLPAYVREALERAKTFAIGRLEGQANYVLTTDDLTGAALSLYTQLDAQNAAGEGERRSDLEASFEGAISNVVNKSGLYQGPTLVGNLAPVNS